MLFINSAALLPGENVVISYRFSGRKLFKIAIFFILWGGGFGFYLGWSFRNDITVGAFMVGVLVLLFLAALVVVKPFLGWLFSYYSITNMRIIISEGILVKNTREIYLHKIDEIVIRRNLIQRVLKCGDIQLKVSNNIVDLSLEDISSVKYIERVLHNVIGNLSKSQFHHYENKYEEEL